MPVEACSALLESFSHAIAQEAFHGGLQCPTFATRSYVHWTSQSWIVCLFHLFRSIFGKISRSPGQAIRFLTFVETGMASMTTAFEDGSEVEVGMFGYESVIGVSALMGSLQSLNRVYTQIAGYGYQCPVANASAEFERSGASLRAG